MFPQPSGLLQCNFSSEVRSQCVKAGWGRGSLSEAAFFFAVFFFLCISLGKGAQRQMLTLADYSDIDGGGSNLKARCGRMAGNDMVRTNCSFNCPASCFVSLWCRNWNFEGASDRVLCCNVVGQARNSLCLTE